MWSLTLFTTLSLITLLPSNVYANTPIHQSVVDKEGLYPFVLASRPLWEFGIPSKGLCFTRTAPCYPDTAVDPNTGAQHPGADLNGWPNAAGGCRSPSENGQAGGTRGRSFPNYYISRQCNPDEIRVGYWIYFPKDGFTGTGHRHDWEYYIVVWRRDGGGNYFRDRHILSYHSGRIGTGWGGLKDTVNDDLSPASGGNHSKVYVAWSKHAMFDTKKTTVCDTLLQSTLVAYRSDDWWYYAEPSDLIVADTSTQIGRWIDEIGQRGAWGSATSWPATRGAEICQLEATQNGRMAAASFDDEIEAASAELESLGPHANVTFPLGARDLNTC